MSNQTVMCCTSSPRTLWTVDASFFYFRFFGQRWNRCKALRPVKKTARALQPGARHASARHADVAARAGLRSDPARRLRDGRSRPPHWPFGGRATLAAAAVCGAGNRCPIGCRRCRGCPHEHVAPDAAASLGRTCVDELPQLPDLQAWLLLRLGRSTCSARCHLYVLQMKHSQ